MKFMSKFVAALAIGAILWLGAEKFVLRPMAITALQNKAANGTLTKAELQVLWGKDKAKWFTMDH
jgi:hypothetical protein